MAPPNHKTTYSRTLTGLLTSSAGRFFVCIIKLNPKNPAALRAEGEEQLTEGIQTELIRRQKKAAGFVIGFLIMTALFAVLAYLGKERFRHDQTPFLDVVVRITILVFGLGAVALRRTRFTAMRLQDIGALEGPDGLLRTLERTTVQLALLGGAIVVIGFAATTATSNDFYTYGAALVGTAVLLYAYPTRNSWQRTLRQFAPENGLKPESNLLS